jgi:WD40 repeat protein
MTNDDLRQRYELSPADDDVLITYERQLWQARFSPCGRYLIGCGYDATIQRWDLAGEQPQQMSPMIGHSGWVQEMAFQPQTQRLLTADSWGQLACWTYSQDDPQPVWRKPEAHEGWIRALAVSPDGELVATGGNGSLVRLWSTAEGKLEQELPHPHRVYSLSFHPDGKSLVSGDLTGVIRQWNLDDAKEVRQLSAETLYTDEVEAKGRIQQCGGARHLNFDPAGKRLVCAGQKEPSGGFATGTPCVLVYDWESGEQIREMPMGGTQDGFAYDARFHPHGFVMATSSAFPGKGHVWFWRPEDEEPFFSSNKLANGRSLSLHPDGQRIAHLTAQSPNGNGRALKDGQYVGGTANIRLLSFPTPPSP